MFEVTSRAAAALVESRKEIGAGELAIRICVSESGNGSSAGYQVRFASHPAAGDLVIDSAGLRVFIADDLVAPLDASVLDTVETPAGEKLVLKHRRVT